MRHPPSGIKNMPSASGHAPSSATPTSPHRRRTKRVFSDRACSNCGTHFTSQWRTGPSGPSTYTPSHPHARPPPTHSCSRSHHTCQVLGCCQRVFCSHLQLPITPFLGLGCNLSAACIPFLQ
jgi:hypothetical protein